ncbi:MAG: nitroreductase [Marinobacter sp.]|uniref:nitroreductase family protein n=1 Tax=Marinobacter sp. TaxID=50741 RepID=UPI00299DC54B|nr:nitroreductase [Marinobacter sp.]MDX1757321.1 nitroreductase [Marinobacter sp.]
MTDVIEAILSRSSEPRLTAPAPSGEQLEKLLECAFRAPDHAILRPWRYLVIEGEGLKALGELFAQTGATPEEKDKLGRMPLRAPMIIVGITSPKSHPKVPEIEQAMSTAVGMGYLLLALRDAGFGGMWRTGMLAYNAQVKAGLGLAEHESIAGFVYVGTVASEKPAVPRPAVAELVSRWPAQS